MKTITFRSYIDTYAYLRNSSHEVGKVKPIKALRAATDLGLKDSKDLVEEVTGISRRWVMTPHQFGLWTLEAEMINKLCESTCIFIDDAKYHDDTVAHDFTR